MLKTLWLTDNCIGDDGAVAIGEALRVNRSAKLSRLSLFRNSIRNKGSVATAVTLSSALASKRDNFSRFSPCTGRRGTSHLSQNGVPPGGRSPNHRSPIVKRPTRGNSDHPASGVDSPLLAIKAEQLLQRPPIRRASMLSAPPRSTRLESHLEEDEASNKIDASQQQQQQQQQLLQENEEGGMPGDLRFGSDLGQWSETLDGDKLVMDWSEVMRALSPLSPQRLSRRDASRSL